MKKHKHLFVVVTVVLALVLIIAGMHAVRLFRQYAAAKQYRQHMSDPKYLQAQTARLQPTVAQQIYQRFPQAQIILSPQSDKEGNVIYEVHLPAGDFRDLPRLHAQIARLYGEYHRQGYHAKFLLYQNGKVVQCVP